MKIREDPEKSSTEPQENRRQFGLYLQDISYKFFLMHGDLFKENSNLQEERKGILINVLKGKTGRN